MSLRPVRSWATAAALALVCLPTFGCSWLLVQEPSRGRVRYHSPRECTSSVAAPIIDTVGATLFGVSGAILVYEGAQPTASFVDPGRAMIAVGLVAVGVGAAFAGSAAHGYSTTAECRQLKEGQLSCTSGVEDACGSLRAGKPYIKPTEPEPQQQQQ